MPGERTETVFTAELYPLERQPADLEISVEDWNTIIAIKEAVNKVIEAERKEGNVKGSLQTDVTLYLTPELAEVVNKIGDELRFITITSSAKVVVCEEAREAEAGHETAVSGLRVAVKGSGFAKCVRCWHMREDVGVNPDHPELCERCVDNVQGDGEKRRYA